MHNIIEPGGSTVILGPDESWAGIIALQAVLDELAAGAVVVQLTDAASDHSRARAQLWARELRHDPSILDRFHVLDSYRESHMSAHLAARIRKACHDNGTKRVIAFNNLAANMLPIFPGSSWLPLAQELPLAFDGDLSVVTALSYGNPMAPPPRFLDYPADRIWLSKPALNLRFTLAEIKPDRSERKLRGKVHHGGLIVFREDEDVSAQ